MRTSALDLRLIYEVQLRVMSATTPTAKINAVRTPLLELHRLLLLSLKKDHETLAGRVLNPAEWFQTLLSSPEYQWVKPLNSLMADVDALSELSKIGDRDMAILRHHLETLFFKDDEDVTSFNSHYRKAFSQHHELVLSHGQLKEAVGVLPAEKLPLNSDEIRVGWHKIGASKRKLLN